MIPGDDASDQKHRLRIKSDASVALVASSNGKPSVATLDRKPATSAHNRKARQIP